MILEIIIGIFIGGCVGVVVMAIMQMAKDDDKYYLRFSAKLKLEKLYYQWLEKQNEEFKKDNPDSSCVVADSPFTVFGYLDSYNLLDIEKVEEYLIEQEGENDDGNKSPDNN